MKYKVTLYYHGSFTHEVEADNEQKAIEAARDFAAAMSDTEFNKAVELMEEGNDIEEVKPDVNEGWKKPRFTAKDVLEGAHYEEVPYLKDINDSMELDSTGEDLAYLENTITTRCGKKLSLDASVRVVGDVKVFFKGQEYRSASRMPKELIECYRNGTDPAKIDPDYSMVNNNWFEMFVRITTEDGSVIFDDAYVIDDVEEMKECLADTFLEELNENQECLGMLFKESDSVRWDDPDKSVADQMNPDELKEYRQRVFFLQEKKQESASINDGFTDTDVPYSELLLEEA